MDDVTEVVMLFACAFEVRYDIVSVDIVAGEGPSRRQVEVADYFVDVNLACDPAAFLVLRSQLLCPTLLNTLIDAFWVCKAPAFPGVGLADVLAGIATRRVGCRFSAVAGTTVVLTVESCEPIRLSFEPYRRYDESDSISVGQMRAMLLEAVDSPPFASSM